MKPKIFINFLKYYNQEDKDIYTESGFAVKLLVEKFGKQKIIRLIKESSKTQNEKQFKQIFKKIYGFNLNYKEFNNKLNSQFHESSISKLSKKHNTE